MNNSVAALGVTVLLVVLSHLPVVAETPRAAIIVHNRARVMDALMSEARDLVNQVYSKAGIDLVWFSAKPGLKHVPFSGLKLRVMIITRRATERIGSRDHALAYTPGADRGGTLAYVLDHRVRAVARGYSVRPAIVLAAVISHEVGHMLLKTGHTKTGVMRADFNQADFRQFASGELLFSARAAMDMRAHLVEFPAEVRAATADMAGR